MKLRREQPDDAAAIRELTELAFGQPQEAELIEALRAAQGVVLSLVAVDESPPSPPPSSSPPSSSPVLAGHVLFSPVTVTSDEGAFDAVGLGPMTVRPGWQRRGIGAALVRAGLDHLRAAGHVAVVVLGHPAYYPRFGFRRASEYGIRWEHPAPDDAFMVVELRPGSLAGRGGIVRYRPEFDAV